MQRPWTSWVGLWIVTLVAGAGGTPTPRPNILWLTSEDNSPYLGCYGDRQARTPNLDRLAAEGLRYRHAFANAPVCSAARSTLITGMHACSAGIHNHRSSVAIPASFALYPALLRRAGYFCTNNAKTDYNLQIGGQRGTRACWDECSDQADYRHRASGQPFFAVFNNTVSHEGQTTDRAYAQRRRQGRFPNERVVAPERVILPPYHPDTPVIRENWSRYYDNIWLMDQWVGAQLRALEEAGLADDTIVFYYADHGGALPRGKRNIHDSGTRVPLIIRFPEKWAHLAPAAPGQWCEQIVSFVDLPATLCSLAGVPIPAHYEGRAFLGDQARAQDHVFLFRGRMDERYDTVRAIRTPQYLYVNNFSPHRPWGQHYFYPFEVMPSMGSWYEAFREGRCNAVQARYWRVKPGEEFYVVADDPDQIDNRIDDPADPRVLERLRGLLRQRLIETRDTGLIPEGMAARLPGARTLYDYAHSSAYPAERVVDLAIEATSRDRRCGRALIAALGDPHPVVRYWGATGCLILGPSLREAKPLLTYLLGDPLLDVRVVAAEAVAHLGEVAAAQQTLRQVIVTGNPYEALAAINALEALVRAGLVPAKEALALVAGLKNGDLLERVREALALLARGAGEGA